MSDYDAVLAALDALRIIPGHAVVEAAVAYARATVAHRQSYMGQFGSYDRRAADMAQEVAWRALRDAVVQALGPSEQEATDD